MRGDYFERICALLPEIPVEVVRKVVESLNAGFLPREVAQILGYPGSGDAVYDTKKASLFLVLHRLDGELPVPPSAAPEQIIDSISEGDQLRLLFLLNEKRAELLAAKVKSL